MEKQHINQNTNVIILVSKACAQVQDFEALYRRLERRMHTQRRSESTMKNYARHIAQIALHYNCSPIILEVDPIRKLVTKTKTTTGEKTKNET